jgi:hypothetical protein
MIQRALDQMQVAGFLLEPGGECMAEEVERNGAADADFREPPSKSQLDLPLPQPQAG